MAAFTIAGRRFELDRDAIEAAVADELPEPIDEHYVVVGRRRFPPKQVLSRVTGLDRADFTTHHARRILSRLGFIASRRTAPVPNEERPLPRRRLPRGGRQAAALAPYVGKWVALGGPCEVLVAADTPQEVLRWLEQHDRVASGGMFRVPASPEETELIAIS
jgi:predicted amidophosphoribosyltransferase